MDTIILSLTLLAIGVYGLVRKRDLLKILVSIEIIAIAASMNFVMFGAAIGSELGEAFLIIAFSTDTSITAIVLALFITISKKYGTTDIQRIASLKQTGDQRAQEVGNQEGDA